MASNLVPMFGPISLDAPTERDRSLDQLLMQFMDKHVPVMAAEDLKKREKVLGSLRTIFQKWVAETCVKNGAAPDLAAEAGGQIFTSGSYRLGIHEPGSDIDAHCVAPMFCSRTDFFGSLAASIKAHPDVANFNAIETAAVPIITFDFDGINIDLGLASLPRASVPPNIDVDDDQVLEGVDTATEKCLNGPRVTNMIHRLVPNYDSFLPVVRCVRQWAKARGLYGNKMGYLGGVNFNILVAFVCQLYPKASPGKLLTSFFKVMRSWQWPNPVHLVKPFDAGLGLEVWQASMNPWHVMPIITPAYPGMNSSMSVSQHSLTVMMDEFVRGDEICKQIVEDLEAGREVTAGWEQLLDPSPFFIKYHHYLALDIMAGSEGDFMSWSGYMQSRLRKLLDNFSFMRLPMIRLHLYPHGYDTCCSGGVGGELPAHCSCFFIGFDIDKRRMNGQTLDLKAAFGRFEEAAMRVPFHQDGMHVALTHFLQKDLPEIVFGSLGGKANAVVKRMELRKAIANEKRERIESIRAAAALRLQEQAEAGAETNAEAEAEQRDEDAEEGGGTQEEVKQEAVIAKEEPVEVDEKPIVVRKRRRPEVVDLVSLDPIVHAWQASALEKAAKPPSKRLVVELVK
jgi:poly(A) polymerase